MFSFLKKKDKAPALDELDLPPPPPPVQGDTSGDASVANPFPNDELQSHFDLSSVENKSPPGPDSSGPDQLTPADIPPISHDDHADVPPPPPLDAPTHAEITPPSTDIPHPDDHPGMDAPSMPPPMENHPLDPPKDHPFDAFQDSPPSDVPGMPSLSDVPPTDAPTEPVPEPVAETHEDLAALDDLEAPSDAAPLPPPPIPPKGWAPPEESPFVHHDFHVPPPKPIAPKKPNTVHYQDESIYVKSENFSTIVNDIIEIKQDLDNQVDILGKMSETTATKDKQFTKWKSHLESMQKQLAFVDKTIFQR